MAKKVKYKKDETFYNINRLCDQGCKTNRNFPAKPRTKSRIRFYQLR